MPARRAIVFLWFCTILAVAAAPALDAVAQERAAAFGIEVRQGRRPMPGVEVRLQSEGPVRGTAPPPEVTDAEGRAELWWLTPGIWRVDLLVDGEVAYFLTVRLDPGRRAEEMGAPARDADAPDLRWKFFRPSGPPPEPPPPPVAREEAPFEAPAAEEPAAEEAPAPEAPTEEPAMEEPAAAEPETPEAMEPEAVEPDVPAPAETPPPPMMSDQQPPPTDDTTDEPPPTPDASEPPPGGVEPEPATPPPPMQPQPREEPSAGSAEDGEEEIGEAEVPEPAAEEPSPAEPPAMETEAEPMAEPQVAPAAPSAAAPAAPSQEPPLAEPPVQPEPPAPEPQMPEPEEPEPSMPEPPAAEPPVEDPAPQEPPPAEPAPIEIPDADVVPPPAEEPRVEPAVPMPPPRADRPEPGPVEAAPVEPAPQAAPRFTTRSGAAGDCPDCKEEEIAVTVERTVAPGDPGGAGDCGGGMTAAAQEAARRLAGRAEGLGPGMPLDGGGVASYTAPGASCQVLGVVLPPGVRYRGYTYAVEAGGGAGGPCYFPNDCPVAGAVWPARPVIEELGGGARMVYGVFRNAAAVPLRAKLTVYYVAE